MDPHDSPKIDMLNRRGLMTGVIVGGLYGAGVRLLVAAPMQKIRLEHLLLEVMSLSFVALGPIVIGFMTVHHAAKEAPIPPWKWLLAPWLSVTLAFGITALLNIEGTICLLFALPIGFVFGSLGGLLGGLTARRLRAHSRSTMVCAALLPFIAGSVESNLNAPTQTRTVASEIRIHAAADTVWRNIERVPAISPAELRPNWTHRIGFPRPIEATLSYEGIGGVRHASFEHGVLFIETITAWEPDQRLAFSIHADTANIPPTTLDEHVTIGGRYFDVLNGEYRLEQLPDGDIMLHLSSRQRLSTDFNNYAGLWTDAVMQSLQTSILEVVRDRCQRSR